MELEIDLQDKKKGKHFTASPSSHKGDYKILIFK